MAGCIVDTLTTLKALTGVNKFDGLALVVQAKKAWYMCDIASIEPSDDENVVTPDDGIGRWIKCNNESNVLNSGVSQTTDSASTTVDFTNTEEIHLLLNQSTSIQFPVTLRNGYGYLILNRAGGAWAITAWDTRVKFTGTSYNFTNGINVAVIDLIFMNNNIYMTKVSEYV